ncbi:hypothetical protein GCM10009789_82370 [Kribbella sancticallisti]|uniref:HTH luxR-type domain-containing protein n=1 Tax=Kribbella sancticallisti TaxID=460087 RepID=A0ABN2EUK0_9ACTN
MSTKSVSRREAEVLALIDEHLSNAQIAGRLHISVRTVENHVASMLRKYGVSDRRALAVIARRTPSEESVLGPIAGLPAWRTAFTGRAHERDTVLALLRPGALVTLTGSGGVGKTRLAAVVAAELGQSGAFVDLVPVNDVAGAVARRLGVIETAEQSIDSSVVTFLGRSRRLLILDNCEHVLDEVAALADTVLAHCPGVTILATSRERLGVPGERVVPISPLPLASDAEALFVDRVNAVDVDLLLSPAVVAGICARLDGVPLAIELAAARCASLGADGLLAALDDTLRVLTGSRHPDQRHRSLSAVIGWSHDLLDEDEQILFARMAVFAAGFDLDAAERVAAVGGVADVLGRLVDKSLVVRDKNSWRLLETVRAYALNRLAARGELEQTRELYLWWAADTARELSWERFDDAADNLQAALQQAPRVPGEPGHGLARSLGRLTYAHGLASDALEYYEEAADRATDPSDAAADLYSAAQTAFAVGLARGVFELFLKSAVQARAAGNHPAEAAALAQAVVTAGRFPSGFSEPVPPTRLRALAERAEALGSNGDPIIAAHLAAAAAWCPASATGPPPELGSEGLPPYPEMVERAVASARATGDAVLLCAALDAPGTVALRGGKFGRAHRIAQERLALVGLMDRRHPSSAPELLDTFHNAWLCAFAAGDLESALSTAEYIAQDELLGGHPYRGTSKLIPPLVLLGRLQEALLHAEPMWTAWQGSGAPIAAWLSPAASSVALAHGLLDDLDAYRLWRARAKLALRGVDAAHPALVFAAFVDARVASHHGFTEDAKETVERAFAGSSTSWSAAYARAAGAELAVLAQLPDAELRRVQAGSENENLWAAACLTGRRSGGAGR